MPENELSFPLVWVLISSSILYTLVMVETGMWTWHDKRWKEHTRKSQPTRINHLTNGFIHVYYMYVCVGLPVLYWAVNLYTCTAVMDVAILSVKLVFPVHSLSSSVPGPRSPRLCAYWYSWWASLQSSMVVGSQQYVHAYRVNWYTYVEGCNVYLD